MRGVLPPEMSCFHAVRTHFGGQPWALLQQEQRGPEDKPWPSRAAGRAWLSCLLLAHEELRRAGWWGCCAPFTTTRTGKAGESQILLQWAVDSTPVFESFPSKICWANSTEVKVTKRKVCPGAAAGLVFAFPLGFHDVILPLLAFTQSHVCLWPREERVIFYFNCPTMHPVLSPGWIFGCSMWCVHWATHKTTSRKFCKFTLLGCVTEWTSHCSSSPLQWQQPSTQTQNALYTWKSYFQSKTDVFLSSVGDYTNRASHWPPWPVS